MSQQQQQQQQQPIVVYPNTVTTQKKPTSHSNGSFGTVFIVLAVIVAISAIACFLGRLCNTRFHNHRPKPTHKKANPQTHNFPDPGHPREGGDPESGDQTRIRPDTQNFRPRPRPRDEDVEYGFDPVRGPREGGVDPWFDQTRGPREGVVDSGFDRARSGREGGVDFGPRVASARIIRGFDHLSENGEVHKFAGGDPRASAYDPHRTTEGPL